MNFKIVVKVIVVVGVFVLFLVVCGLSKSFLSFK